MKRFGQITKRFLASWLLILFIGYVGSVTLFFHAHLINGQLIAHSHPYADAPDTGRHTHTASDFIVISFLSVLLMLSASLGCLFRLFIPSFFEKIVPVIYSLRSRKISVLSLRGPPVC